MGYHKEQKKLQKCLSTIFTNHVGGDGVDILTLNQLCVLE